MNTAWIPLPASIVTLQDLTSFAERIGVDPFDLLVFIRRDAA